jgi:hypothetical protein
MDDQDNWDGEGGAAGGDGEGVMADGVAGGLLDSVRAVTVMGMAQLLLQVGSEEATDGLRDSLGSGGRFR